MIHTQEADRVSSRLFLESWDQLANHSLIYLYSFAYL